MDAGEGWIDVSEQDREPSGRTRDGLHRKARQNLTALVRRRGQLRQVESTNGAVVVIPARDVSAFCDADSPQGWSIVR